MQDVINALHEIDKAIELLKSVKGTDHESSVALVMAVRRLEDSKEFLTK